MESGNCSSLGEYGRISQSMSSPRLILRVNQKNANHHLWNNNGNWWLHYTLRMPDTTKKRIRKSLCTKDVNHARRLRDEQLAALECSN